MAPPAPLSLKLKRKRDDAPLDALYLESDAATQSDFEFLYVYKRAKSNETSRQETPVEQRPIRQPVDASGIPIVLPTISDDPTALSVQLQSFKLNGSIQAEGKHALRAPGAESALPIKPNRRPRRFYLSRPLSPQLPNQQLKDALPTRKRVGTPVFEERVFPKRVRTEQTWKFSPLKQEVDVDMTEAEGQKRERKRPIVTPAERAFRQHEWGHEKQNSEKAKEPGAQQLSPSMQDLLNEVNAIDKKITTRPIEPPQQLDTTTDAMDIDTSSNLFVYDTYIRELIPADEKYLLPNYGLAVIEDDPFWDDWQDEDEIQADDDDDSNTEDAPTADYPEELSDEDDEFDPYEYRDEDVGFLDDEQEYLRDQRFDFAPAENGSDREEDGGG